MSGKKIWIINQEGSTPETGMGGRYYYLSEELSKLGHQVNVIVGSYNHIMRKPREIHEKVFIEKRSDNFNIVWVKTPYYEKANSAKRVFSWFLFTIRILLLNKKLKKPDVVICTSPPLIPFLGALRLAKKLKSKLVFDVRDIWPLTLCEVGGVSKKHPFIRLLEKIEALAYLKSDIVISNLFNAAEHMKQFGLEETKSSWIPNGISLRELEKLETLPENIRTQIPKDKFIIGYLGTLGEANALEYFLLAASHLKSHENLVFLLVGEGRYKIQLQKIKKELKLENVIFISSIPKLQVQSILALFDVCYLGAKDTPLYKYGMSFNKLFDYLYAAKPIIYGVNSGAYRPIEEAKAGLHIKPEDSHAIAEAVLSLYSSSPEQLKNMGENGKQLVLTQYNYANLALKLEKIIFSDV